MVVFERLREFERLASMMRMPMAERIGILNVSEEAYASLRSGRAITVKPELERRLSYALPLMRRLASKTASMGLPTASRLAA